jgi:hypothetical protein
METHRGNQTLKTSKLQNLFIHVNKIKLLILKSKDNHLSNTIQIF